MALAAIYKYQIYIPVNVIFDSIEKKLLINYTLILIFFSKVKYIFSI